MIGAYKHSRFKDIMISEACYIAREDAVVKNHVEALKMMVYWLEEMIREYEETNTI